MSLFFQKLQLPVNPSDFAIMMKAAYSSLRQNSLKPYACVQLWSIICRSAIAFFLEYFLKFIQSSDWITTKTPRVVIEYLKKVDITALVGLKLWNQSAERVSKVLEELSVVLIIRFIRFSGATATFFQKKVLLSRGPLTINSIRTSRQFKADMLMAPTKL